MRILDFFKKYPPLFISYVFTFLMYLLGIGLVSVIGRIAGVKFLGTTGSSSWVPHQPSRSHDRMY